MLATGGVKVREVKCPVTWHSTNLKNVHSREIPVVVYKNFSRERMKGESVNPPCRLCPSIVIFRHSFTETRPRMFCGDNNARKTARAVHVSKIRVT